MAGAEEARGICPPRPRAPLVLRDEPDRPQPRRDADGRATAWRSSVGRVRRDPVFHVKLVAMAHNIIRGAAGASVLNAELHGCARAARAAVIVLKFGGTSVADAAAIRRAAAIVRGAGAAPIVVVSALAGATNALLAIAEQAARGQLIVALRSVEALRKRQSTRPKRCSATGREADDVIAAR